VVTIRRSSGDIRDVNFMRSNSHKKLHVQNDITGPEFIYTKYTSKIAVIAQSVQRWATGWTIGVLGFDSRRGLGIFLFTTASRTALWPTQPPIQWVPGDLYLGVKRLGREADHSPPSSAVVKE
jgi:hypothetical protein